tara:strand:+ start:1017 stop:1946 length:930 start_codon:yes stop_codon:yes gene_type:complete
MSKKKHINEPQYWRYKASDDRKNSFILFLKNIIENIFNIKITKKKNFLNFNEISSRPLSKNLIDLRNQLLINQIKKFLKSLNIDSSEKRILNLIKKHDRVFYIKNPIKNNYGGINFNNSLFLFIFINSINLKTIIESGVWQGYTTFLFDQYYKKIKKISFDINFDRIIYKSKNFKYCNYDIENYKFDEKLVSNKTFSFFDDHVSQLDRLNLADKLKIKYIVFDDDLDYSAIHSDGWPSIPTIAMLNSKNKYTNFAWKYTNRKAYSKIKINKKNSLLKKYIYITAPNISRITGYYHQPPMSFLVRKKKYE